MMQGWIKLHRKIIEHEIWSDVTTFRLFTFLLLRASHHDGNKINGMELKQGQFIRSYSKLCEDLSYKEGRGLKKVSKSTILRSVKKLVSKGMVTVSETDNGTLFTIVNYQSYQELNTPKESFRETEDEPFTERIQNEVGTNPELKQELKNSRKEEEEEEKSNLSPFQQIENKFSQRKGSVFLSPMDVESINRVLEDNIPLDYILKWIDDIFDEYKPRHRADSINSFSYCEKAILDRWAACQNQKEGKVGRLNEHNNTFQQYRSKTTSHYHQPPQKVSSIFGTGRLRRRG
ncbi:hypothetical protein PJ311_18315 [Bacillus sp. CLL-7-23]|uniref:DNA replication protein DnaD n=1 Tax=Bacillus changyiensis TaxID=3004103 RepID=A0ABT4X879_9BACI|nr:hypothetical protein [Bacillus changyiensis]MDA7028496.1 hypothetical protein [Bacillus changyiensis]